MFKLLIFDWDGTLMDSSDRIVSSMQRAAKALSLSVPSKEAIRNIIGLSLEQANKIIIPGISAANNKLLQQQYSHQYSQIDKTATPFYPDVLESLMRLKNKGYMLAVATGKSRRGLDRVLAEASLGGMFDITRGADEAKSKPDPLMLTQIIEAVGVSITQAVMVGDTSYDLEMAQRIGMPSIAVSYGMHSVERLKKYNPVMVADKFLQIEEWLDGESK
ncbi:MAG: HAD-IIIA family hydrolase [Oceanospirillaceae bacterium]|nr:HAD-IIIA family hydrolase [Oceanospirillaceae bacterium]